MNNINIIMYHYVRPIKGSRWPEIKGLELDGFKRQLDYLLSNFEILTADDIISAVMYDKILPNNACWLTFDDGYKDHSSYVLPELLKRKIQGSFFPPVKPIIDRKMLDVNSIHHILASTKNINMLLNDLNNEIRDYGYSNRDICNLWNDYAVETRYDAKEVEYIKSQLQHALPEAVRNTITSSLFQKYVGLSQTDFADELYMSEIDVRELVNSGMYVGSHGYSHLWLDKVGRNLQRLEIESSLKFLNSVGARTINWIMCYPYGAYNEDTLDLLGMLKCAVGVTTQVGKANLFDHNPLELPRFDTNDFPQ